MGDVGSRLPDWRGRLRAVADQADAWVKVPYHGDDPGFRRSVESMDCVIAARERRVRRTRSLHGRGGALGSAGQGRIALNSKSRRKSTMVSRPNCRAPNRPVNYELQNSAQEKERALCDYRFQIIDFKAPGLPVDPRVKSVLPNATPHLTSASSPRDDPWFFSICT